MQQKPRNLDPDRCPKCGQADAVISIVYGYPASEAEQAAERGEVALGGCVVGDIDPRCTCRRCHIAFDFERPELATGKAAELGWVEEGGRPEQVEDE